MATWSNRLVGASPAARRWLTDRDSLTRRLRMHCSDFSVCGVSLRHRPALPDERALVALPAVRRALVRDVWLYCGEQPRVFAHSVLPVRSLAGRWRRLARIGRRPLGETLFADVAVRRGALQFCLLPRWHPLSAPVAALRPGSRFWARRSLFGLGSKRILVTEVFMPDVFAE